MLMTVILTLLLSINISTAQKKIDFDQRAMNDAVFLVGHLMLAYENAPLEDIPQQSSLEESGQKIDPMCYITQPDVENFLKAHALTYEGGVTTQHMTRVAKRMTIALGLYADAIGNSDGKVMLSELKEFLGGENVKKNNGMFFLLCFIERFK